MTYSLSGTGVWNASLRYGDPKASAEAAAELESLGYTAMWLPDVGGALSPPIETLLAATTTATVASGILNLWMHTPADTAAEYTRLVAAHGPRFLMGIGVSHSALINNAEPDKYSKPLTHMTEFLDGLDAQSPTVPVSDRVLAALGPKMLELSHTRAAGTHPYLVIPEHTARARAAVGADALVLPEQGVVLETDPDRARTVARAHLATYLTLPNYVNNWYRHGFTEDDTKDGGSDRLV